MTKDINKYDADSITVLEGLEAVRKRPGMYIGNTDDGSGLHHMIFELQMNSIDEISASGQGSKCNNIELEMYEDGSFSVSDNGRGIPVDMHKKEGVSAAEVIMTKLHAGGKFNRDSYKISGGLHGLGLSVVNALSEWLELRIFRDGYEHEMFFDNGIPRGPLVQCNASKKHGTYIRFKPSAEIFKIVDFDFEYINNSARELAFLNSGVSITLKSPEKQVVHHYEGGIEEFLKYRIDQKEPLCKTITCSETVDNIQVNIAFTWVKEFYSENFLCFANNVYQADGGTHLSGFKSAITRFMRNYITSTNFNKKGLNITGDDIREGMYCIISIRIPEPKFSSQTKEKLINSEARGAVEQAVSNMMKDFVDFHAVQISNVIQNIIRSSQARESARNAKDAIRKSESSMFGTLSGKMADCRSSSPEECELFFVEGDSAGGSAKQARDRHFQAILPLSGKIINVEKTNIYKALAFKEISDLVCALGTGIGDTFDIQKLRFHKLIIMTDADVDGAHIRTLLLTVFFKYLRPLIENGNVYIAQPPLFSVKNKKSISYFHDETALNTYLIDNGIDNVVAESMNPVEFKDLVLCAVKMRALIQNTAGVYDSSEFILELYARYRDKDNVLKYLNQNAEYMSKWYYHETENEIYFNHDKGSFVQELCVKLDAVAIITNQPCVNLPDMIEGFDGKQLHVHNIAEMIEFIIGYGLTSGSFISRYKGLGEMNPSQLWETTLDPDNRTLYQVKIGDIEEAASAFSDLMGDDSTPRKVFIQEYASRVRDLDL